MGLDMMLATKERNASRREWLKKEFLLENTKSQSLVTVRLVHDPVHRGT